MNWKETAVEMIRAASTNLPDDVESAIRNAASVEETGSRAAFVLNTILENIKLARTGKVPMCQDTGTLTFWLDLPYGTDALPITVAIREAVAESTSLGLLRQNTILEPSGKSLPTNLSDSHPVIHFDFSKRNDASVSLLLKGGGSENMSRQYSLPDQDLGAGRDLDGVRKCIVDAIAKAKGNGCAPGIIGVCIGGDRATGYEIAKKQLLRKLSDESSSAELAALEKQVISDAQALGIGPMGMGGKTTVLAVKIGAASRLPASFFVSIAYLCWAGRRLTVDHLPVE